MRISKLIVLAILVALSSPGWSINKCTGPDGKVAFQDAACGGKGEKLDVRPAAGAAPTTSTDASAPKRITEADRLNALTDASQRDRRRRELQERLVPGAQADLANNKQQCELTQKELEADQYRYKQNLYGKTHAAQIASEMAAAASKCNTKDRDLRESMDTLRKECQALGGCK